MHTFLQLNFFSSVELKCSKCVTYKRTHFDVNAAWRHLIDNYLSDKKTVVVLNGVLYPTKEHSLIPI